MKKRFGLAFLLVSATLAPALAHAGETADLLASRVTFPVPHGLCALPENETGKLIFARLDQIQRDIGNRLIAVFPSCADAGRIKDGQQPGFSHYAAVATVGQAVTGGVQVSREEIIRDTTAQLTKGDAGAAAMDLLKNAEESLTQLGVQDIKLTQPVSYIGQDELAVYALLRQRVNGADNKSIEVMGVLSATAFSAVPVFVYYYDSPPAKGSSVRLYEANKAYVTKLESTNAKPQEPAPPPETAAPQEAAPQPETAKPQAPATP